MDFLTWITENFRNGEIFFYVIPIFLFILLLLTIFLPDEEKKSKKEKTEEKDKESEPVMMEDLSHERVKIEDIVKKTDEIKEKIPVSIAEERAEEKHKAEEIRTDETLNKEAVLVEPLKEEVITSEKTEEEMHEEVLTEKPASLPEPAVTKELLKDTETKLIKKEEKTIEIEKIIDTAIDSFEIKEKQEKTEEPEKIDVILKGEILDIEPSGEEEAQALVEKPKSFKDGLSGTRGGFMSKLKNLFSSSIVDDDLIEEMEEILYTADIGVPTVSHLMAQVEKNRKNFKSGEDVRNFLKMEIYNIVETCEKKLEVKELKPFIMLMVGVNGAGKTTTIGKLTRKFKENGKSVLLAAGDTFRAAAVEQLSEWGKRTDTEVIKDSEGADPAAVTFNAVNAAKSRNIDVAIIDTAGRLQNRVNLMNELEKVKRVTAKARENGPDEIILVVDANNGQNALSQAVEFNKAVGLTGIIITKLDGSAKGGVIIGIAKELKLPIYYIGIGESAADLREFNAEEFVEALFV